MPSALIHYVYIYIYISVCVCVCVHHTRVYTVYISIYYIRGLYYTPHIIHTYIYIPHPIYYVYIPKGMHPYPLATYLAICAALVPGRSTTSTRCGAYGLTQRSCAPNLSSFAVPVLGLTREQRKSNGKSTKNP